MSKQPFFAISLQLQFRIIKRKLLALLAMALAALLLSAAVATAGTALLGKNNSSNVTLAMSFASEEREIAILMGIISSSPALADYFNLQIVPTQEAKTMLQNGHASAAILFPPGFVSSVLRGDNWAPNLLLNSAQGLESSIVMILAQSVIPILARAQQGIALTLDLYQAEGITHPEWNDAVREINLRYINFVVAPSIFQYTEVSPTGALSIAPHYLLCSALFFTALTIPLLFRLYSLRAQAGWLQRLRSAGCPLVAYSAAQILAGTLALMAMLILLLAGIGFAGSTQGPAALPRLVPGILLISLCLSCFGYLCCNVGNITAAVSINFLLVSVSLVLAGGLIPRVLLPTALAAMVPFSPFRWMLDGLSPLFGVSPPGLSLALLAIFTLLLLGASLLMARHTEQRGIV